MKKFEAPEMKTVNFEVADVISTSTENEGPVVNVNGLPIG